MNIQAAHHTADSAQDPGAGLQRYVITGPDAGWLEQVKAILSEPAATAMIRWRWLAGLIEVVPEDQVVARVRRALAAEPRCVYVMAAPGSGNLLTTLAVAKPRLPMRGRVALLQDSELGDIARALLQPELQQKFDWLYSGRGPVFPDVLPAAFPSTNRDDVVALERLAHAEWMHAFLAGNDSAYLDELFGAPGVAEGEDVPIRATLPMARTDPSHAPRPASNDVPMRLYGDSGSSRPARELSGTLQFDRGRTATWTLKASAQGARRPTDRSCSLRVGPNWDGTRSFVLELHLPAWMPLLVHFDDAQPAPDGSRTLQGLVTVQDDQFNALAGSPGAIDAVLSWDD